MIRSRPHLSPAAQRALDAWIHCLDALNTAGVAGVTPEAALALLQDETVAWDEWRAASAADHAARKAGGRHV